jgi:hypothetical protein
MERLVELYQEEGEGFPYEILEEGEDEEFMKFLEGSPSTFYDLPTAIVDDKEKKFWYRDQNVFNVVRYVWGLANAYIVEKKKEGFKDENMDLNVQSFFQFITEVVCLYKLLDIKKESLSESTKLKQISKQLEPPSKTDVKEMVHVFLGAKILNDVKVDLTVISRNSYKTNKVAVDKLIDDSFSFCEKNFKHLFEKIFDFVDALEGVKYGTVNGREFMYIIPLTLPVQTTVPSWIDDIKTIKLQEFLKTHPIQDKYMFLEKDWEYKPSTSKTALIVNKLPSNIFENFEKKRKDSFSTVPLPPLPRVTRAIELIIGDGSLEAERFRVVVERYKKSGLWRADDFGKAVERIAAHKGGNIPNPIWLEEEMEEEMGGVVATASTATVTITPPATTVPLTPPATSAAGGVPPSKEDIDMMLNWLNFVAEKEGKGRFETFPTKIELNEKLPPDLTLAERAKQYEKDFRDPLNTEEQKLFDNLIPGSTPASILATSVGGGGGGGSMMTGTVPPAGGVPVTSAPAGVFLNTALTTASSTMSSIVNFAIGGGNQTYTKQELIKLYNTFTSNHAKLITDKFELEDGKRKEFFTALNNLFSIKEANFWKTSKKNKLATLEDVYNRLKALKRLTKFEQDLHYSVKTLASSSYEDD